MKRLIYLIKWLPFALVVLMVLHCLLLMCGIYSNFLAHNGVSPLLYVVMLVLSYKLDFCCFHRLALHYDLAVWCFCWLRDYGILDDFLTPLRVVILSVGIVIISVTLTSKYYGKRCGGQHNSSHILASQCVFRQTMERIGCYQGFPSRSYWNDWNAPSSNQQPAIDRAWR